MKNSFQKKLASYSSLATSIVAFQNSNAQIIYTDVNPDSVIMNEGSYDLDLNNDGKFDAAIELVKWKSGYNPSFAQLYAQYDSNNYFSVAVEPFYYSSSANVNYVKLLSDGQLIDSNLNFANVYGAPRFVLCYFGDVIGSWSNIKDGFVAIRFKFEGITKYGWCRCSTSECAEEVTIKEYAYEDTPGVPIKAGAISVAVIEVYHSKGISVQNLVDQIKIEALGVNLPAMLRITNAIGQVVFDDDIKNEVSFISTNSFSSGIYIVTIESRGKLFTAKFTH